MLPAPAPQRTTTLKAPMSLPAMIGDDSKALSRRTTPDDARNHKDAMADAAAGTTVITGYSSNGLSSPPNCERSLCPVLAKPFPASTAEMSTSDVSRVATDKMQMNIALDDRCSLEHACPLLISPQELMDTGMAASSVIMRLRTQGGSVLASDPLDTHGVQTFHQQKQAWTCPCRAGLYRRKRGDGATRSRASPHLRCNDPFCNRD